MSRFFSLCVLVVCASLALSQGRTFGVAKVGGKVSPDGKTEVQIDLPDNLQKRNISSSGLGCCVFRSLEHAAHWAHEPALWGMPEWMVSKRIPGGGYPDKVAKLIPQIAKDRGMPTPAFLQVEGQDIEIIKAACKSGRMACVTYNYSPTPGRYGGRIAHMVNVIHADDHWFVVLDNNYVGSNQYQWMDPETFKGVYTGGRSGWTVILLRHGPPLPPCN